MLPLAHLQNAEMAHIRFLKPVLEHVLVMVVCPYGFNNFLKKAGR